jgi:hypothetical protein
MLKINNIYNMKIINKLKQNCLSSMYNLFNTKTIKSGSLLILSFLFTIYCQKHSLLNNQPALPDVLHKINQRFNLSHYYKLTDIPVNLLISLVVLVYNKNIDKWLYKLSILYFIRAVSFYITVLPKCSSSSLIDLNKSTINIFWDFLTGKTSTRMNSDLLPSGHTLIMWLSCLHIKNNYSNSIHLTTFYKTFQVHPDFYKLLCIVNSLFIILTRNHYSIDVLYAYITTNYIDLIVK